MTAKELAAQLDGCEYREENVPRYDNLLVIYGQSDDLIELGGAIEDEIQCWIGDPNKRKTFNLRLRQINGKWEFLNPSCGLNEYKKGVESWIPPPNLSITAIWSTDKANWEYETNLECERFKVMEDGDVYCIGLVIDLTQLLTLKNQ